MICISLLDNKSVICILLICCVLHIVIVVYLYSDLRRWCHYIRSTTVIVWAADSRKWQSISVGFLVDPAVSMATTHCRLWWVWCAVLCSVTVLCHGSLANGACSQTCCLQVELNFHFTTHCACSLCTVHCVLIKTSQIYLSPVKTVTIFSSNFLNESGGLAVIGCTWKFSNYFILTYWILQSFCSIRNTSAQMSLQWLWKRLSVKKRFWQDRA